MGTQSEKCDGCGAVATIKELDQMYARILVKLTKSEELQREQHKLLLEHIKTAHKDDIREV